MAKPFIFNNKKILTDRIEKKSIWYIMIWHGSLDYEGSENGYFNITLYVKSASQKDNYYYTADTVYGLLEFFKDFFSNKTI
jgi:hypothetical protein